MINAVSNSTVPHLVGDHGRVVRRRQLRHERPRLRPALPLHLAVSAKSAVMGPAQLAGVLSIVARRPPRPRARSTTRRATPGMRDYRRGSTVEEQSPAVLPVRDALRRRRHRPARHPHRAGHLPVRHRERARSRAPTASASSGCDATTMITTTARRQPRRDRPPGLRDLPRASASRRSPCTPTPTPALPFVGEADARRTAARATRPPTPTCAPTWSSRPRGGPAPTRSTPATASCPRTPTSPAPSIDAGLTWVGPPPESIEAMGSKVAAKELDGEGRRAGARQRRPADGRPRPTFPLLVKASAGGGGRGMRVVRTPRPAARPRSTAAAPRPSRPSATARSSSSPTSSAGPPRRGAGRRPTAGTASSRSATRDCSVQRRHQKVVEEAPAPGLPAGSRGGDVRGGPSGWPAASTTAAPGPSSSSTTRPTERFFFLEMNTRLQVEHPVTELRARRSTWSSCSCRGGRGRGSSTARERRAGGPRDRGAALRRGPGGRLPAAERRLAHLRPARRRRRVRPADRVRRPGRRGLRVRRRGRRPTTTRCWPR